MKKLFLLALLISLFTPLQAEILPLPEVDYSFIYNTEEKPLINPQRSEQIQCNDVLCHDADALGVYGSQKLSCGAGSCHAVAYRFDPYQKLVVAFDDGTVRESNVFALPPAFYTRLNVYVENDKLVVEPSGYTLSFWDRMSAHIWWALLLILVLELLAAAAYVWYTKGRLTILYSVAVSNIVSTFLAWMVLPAWTASTFVLWLFCLISEALLIWAMNYKRMKAGQAFQLSCAMNVTSYALGMILSFIFA